MKVRLLLLLLISGLVLGLAGCYSTPEVPETGGEFIITDRTGREWDVTHAYRLYNMDPGFFNFGLGIGAIPSVDNPRIIEEGDPDYPVDDSRIQVFGLDHNGEQRAYQVSTLTAHEVVNDVYPGESENYLAVTFWPLANLAVVYSRELDGEVLRLTPSGWTFGEDMMNSVFVLMDKETESLWFPIDQECCTFEVAGIPGRGLLGIGGFYADRILKEIRQLELVSWVQWKERFPETTYIED